MSNLISFLESLGRDARLATTGGDYAAAVDALEIDDQAKATLLAKDASALNDLLGGRPKMICMLFPADGDEKKDGGDEDGEAPAEDEEQPKDSIRH